MELDDLDLALLTALRDHPRAGDLELSRLTSVARATVQSRLRRMEEAGVIRDWQPTIDVAAAGHPVRAFVSLEIAQGALEEVTADLDAIPYVVEAAVTTGSSDVLCTLACPSHEELQATLVAIDRSPSVARSTSVIALSTLIPHRTLPLLATTRRAATRAPAYRTP